MFEKKVPCVEMCIYVSCPIAIRSTSKKSIPLVVVINPKTKQAIEMSAPSSNQKSASAKPATPSVKPKKQATKPANPPPPSAKASFAGKRPAAAAGGKKTFETMKTIPLGSYNKERDAIRHPNHDKNQESLRNYLRDLSALDLSVAEDPDVTGIKTKTVHIDPKKLEGSATDRVWSLGDKARKMGETWLSDGTGIKQSLPEGMAVLEGPARSADQEAMRQAIKALNLFMTQEKNKVKSKTSSITFVPPSKGKFMIGYNPLKTSDMVEDEAGNLVLDKNGNPQHVRYEDSKPLSKADVTVHYVPTMADVLAELPREAAVFLVRYLKGLANLFGCDCEELMDGSLMLLEYTAGGGFSRHIDGIKAFKNQAGAVALLSLTENEEIEKHLDLIPMSAKTPVRITTKAAGETIIMSGLPRVDMPHSIPFGDAGLNPKGPTVITAAFKFSFLPSKGRRMEFVQSKLTGVIAQQFNADVVIAAQKKTVTASAAEFTVPSTVFSASAAEFTVPSMVFSASAADFTPAASFSVSAAEFVPSW